jgi:hypothetical protein
LSEHHSNGQQNEQNWEQNGFLVQGRKEIIMNSTGKRASLTVKSNIGCVPGRKGFLCPGQSPTRIPFRIRSTPWCELPVVTEKKGDGQRTPAAGIMPRNLQENF